MAADPTLVRAAFSEAESRAKATIPSMTPLFESSMRMSKQIVTDVEKIFAELALEEKEREIGAENQLSVFRGKLDTAFESLYNEKQPLPVKVHDAVYDQLKNIQAQFELVNTYGDDDNPENEKARALLTVRLQKVVGQAVKARGKLTTIAAMKENVSGEQEYLDIASEIWDVTGNYDKVEMTFNEKDELVWNVTLPEYWCSGNGCWDEKQSWTVADMEKNLIIKNYYKSGVEGDPNAMTAQNYELSKYEELERAGASEKGGEFNESRELSDIKDNLLAKKDPNMLAAIAIQDMDGNPSWRKSLMVNPEIAKAAVEHLFIEDVQIGFTFEDMDRDKDGKIEMGDDTKTLTPDEKRLWKLNYNQIVDALTNPTANGFNYARSESMLADFLVDRRRQAFGVGKTRRPPKPGTTDGFKFNVNQGYTMAMSDGTEKWVSGQLIKTMQDFIDDPREGQVQKAYDGSVYSYKDGKFYMGEGVVTQSRIAKNLGMWDYGYNPKDTYEEELLPPIVEETEEVGAIPSAPSRGLLSTTFDTQEGKSKIIGELEVLYEPFGDFKFESDLGILLITSPDGKESIRVDMGRSFRGSGKAGKKIQAFIKKHAKQTEEEK